MYQRLTSPQDNPELLCPVDYAEIRSLTAKMHQQIGSGTLDAPTWKMIRNAKLAAQIYAPLGTMMSLGHYVRVVKTFLDAFRLAEHPSHDSGSDGDSASKERALREDRKVIQLGDELKVRQSTSIRFGF